MARILVTGATGFVGAALIPRLQAEDHDVRAFARRPEAVADGVAVFPGDAVSGAGLAEALDGVDVAYYLIHSMEASSADRGFDRLEAQAVERFAEACEHAGVRRVVYLGGLVPTDNRPSRHLGSRLFVEERLLAAAPEAVAFRASIVIGAKSRSFRFLVRLVERAPLLPLPTWRDGRTQPVDERDVLAFLAAAATEPSIRGPLSVDIGGAEIVTYGEMVQRIAHHLHVGRPTIGLPFALTPIAAKFVAAIASEDVGLIEPLMESLEADLLCRNDSAPARFGVRLHTFDASIERALRDWERVEALAAR